MISRRITKTSLSILMLLVLLGGVVHAEAPVRDTRSWEDPGGSGLTITFSTPETYYSCTSAFDRIYTEGVPDDWTLDGYVNVYWATPDNGLELVPNGAYVVDQTGDLDLTLDYPPAWSWPDLTPIGNPLREIHVDLGIVVRDGEGQVVKWVGGDQKYAPGILGPGGQDWDVICHPRGSIGDTVWLDNNGDGVQDAGEPGIPGVTVELKDPGGDAVCGTDDDVFIASQVTDENGNYLFRRLPEGMYCVDPDQSTVPDGLVLTTANDPQTVDLAPAEAYRDADFGYQPRGSIGDTVWQDNNGNGVQDVGEPGIPGVTVNLNAPGPDGQCGTGDDVFIASDTTDANGNYLFTDLPQGVYCVDPDETTVPAGYTLTTNNDPQTVDLGPGEDFLDADFGYQPRGSIGDTVWQDNNGNGVQDAGEPGIPGVTVDLNDPGPDGVCGTDDDAFIASDVTDANGNYLFTDLPQGVYCVDPDETTVPAGYTLTTNNDPQTVDLGPGEDFLDADFGYQPLLGSIGDTVWQDNNGNGVQDAGEPGIPGVTVNLNAPGPDGQCGTEDDVFIASDTTDANGNYLFTGLLTGTYCVDPDENTVPAGYVLTTANDPQTVDLGPGEDFLDADFGYQPLGSIGDTVWQDNDGDGVQDPGEPGIPGVTVNLLGPGPDEMCNTGDEVVLDTTTTDASGMYGFGGLTSGTYCVQFVAPPGYVFSPPNQGDGTNDSKADPTTGQTGDVPLAPGENNPNQDAGLYQPASLGDFVWEDLNGDGIQDAGEPGIPEVTVNLLSPGPDGTCNTGDEVFLGTTTTDANGIYGFAGLTPGDYCVEFVAPSGYVFSPPNQGTDDSRDSDADPATGQTIQTINLVSGENDPTWDAGLYRTASLGDFVWEDLNGDGIQDAGEPGISGMTVNLYDCEGNFIASTTTDADGFYSFSGLAPGDYYVEFVAPSGYEFTEPNQGDGTNDSKADPSTGQTDCVGLVSGEVNNNQDAGLYQPASLGDFVWEDLNGDGIQDAGEPGISAVTVNLLSPGPDGSCNTGDEVFLASDTTDTNGVYGFAGLTPGDYCVEFVAPTGYVFSPPNQGTDDSVDSDADPATGQTIQTISLVSGQDDPSWDAGLYQPAALGDYVWQDLNRNGIQDDGDTGINDVTVRLYTCAGDPVATAVTADDTAGVPGYYLFDGLAPGCYEIEFVSPVGYVFSPPNQGTDDALDSDADPATGRTGPVINLISGQTDLDWDAGLYLPMCDLLVNKACQLPPPPPTSFVCSDAKPIDELTMIWNGTQTVNVVAWKGSVGSSVVGTVENVAQGDVVTISGFAGSPNDVYWEIFEAATGVKLGESTFHLSCSDDDMNGPEDCGKPEGDGKGKTGFLNDWLFEGMAGNGQELICTPTPPAPAEACEFVASPNPSCATLGKPTSLTFKYTGGGCAASDNTQDPGKAICTGSIDARLPVAVTTSNSGYTIDPTTVEPGREFTVSASGFDSNSIFQLTNAAGTETNQIHTSCSQPLQVGDVFGSLTLVAFNGQRAATEVTYFYEVFNNGDALSDVTLTDRVGSLPVFTAGPFDLAAGETRSFQSVADVAETTTNVATFSGFLVDGGACAASDEVTVSVVEPCDVCKGGTTNLTLRYLGTTTAEIVVYDDKDPKTNETVFQGTVAPGDEFSFSQRAGQDKMDNDISVWVDGVRNTIIHTSCSQPIGPGLISGDFEIVEGRSKDNGLMCPLNTCDPAATPALEFSGREVRWYVTNNGDVGLEIERISITWPTANGYLDEIKREGDVIHKGNFNPPSALIDSGWEDNPDKRTIKPGDTNVLKFKFQNDVTLAGGYSIVVEFTYGCSVEVSYTPPDNEPPAPVCTGTSVTLQPASEGKDTYILFEKKDDNFGNAGILMTDSEEAAKGPIRSLIQFDLSALSGKTISAARLSLYLFNNGGSQTDVVEAHRLTRDWVEGAATWNRYNSTSTWSSPGGDYDAAVAGSFVASGTGWKTADVTSLTQAWVSNVNPNYGVILLSPPAAGNNEKSYYSGDHTDPTLRPKLEVCYE